MIDKKNLANLDIPLLLATLAISVIGILTVYSASSSPTSPNLHYLKMQTIWVTIGFCLMAVVIFFDYKDYGGVIYLIYGVNILLLLAVIFMGQSRLGAQRWIPLGPFTLQPSEFAKVAVIITLGYLMSREDVRIESLFDLITPGFHVGVPMILIFLQPDLGTSLVFVAITAGMLFVAGLKWRDMAILAVTGVAASIFAFHKVLKDYQKVRLIVFRDPYQYYFDAGFQIVQSKIAIGSGGIWGSFFRKGAQGTESVISNIRDYYDISNQGFLPEAHTDFVFSVIGEKFGLIGTSIVLLLFLFIIYRILHIGMTSSDTYGTYICVGVSALLAFQMLVNVGMTLSIMPVTGLPLPFITYGGSTTMASFIAMGLVLNVGLRRERRSLF